PAATAVVFVGASVSSYLVITGVKWIIHAIELTIDRRARRAFEKMKANNPNVDRIPLPTVSSIPSSGTGIDVNSGVFPEMIAPSDLEIPSDQNLLEDKKYYQSQKNGILKDIADLTADDMYIDTQIQ